MPSRPGGSRDGGLRLGLCDIDMGGSGGGGGGDDGGLERFARLGASTRPVMMLSPKECDCCMLCELLDWCGLPSQPMVASSGQSYSYNVGRAGYGDQCGYRACLADGHDHKSRSALRALALYPRRGEADEIKYRISPDRRRMPEKERLADLLPRPLCPIQKSLRGRRKSGIWRFPVLWIVGRRPAWELRMCCAWAPSTGTWR